MRIDPTHYIWWLLSRSAGIVALALISLSVLVGLTMATRIVQRPGLGRKLVRVHEHLALVSLGAIAVHGLTLLGDGWLRPGMRGILVPFAIGYRPLYVAAGIVGAYLAALLGLSFYARRRIGARLWRRLHRATFLVWVLGVIHTIGAGSDASTVWLRAGMLVTGAPIVFLLLVRVLERGSRAPARAGSAPRPAAAPSADGRAQAGARQIGSGRAEGARRAAPRPAMAEEAA